MKRKGKSVTNHDLELDARIKSVYVGRWNKISTFIGEQAVMGMAGSTWPRFIHLDVQNGGIIYGLMQDKLNGVDHLL